VRKKIIPLTIACFLLGLVLVTQIRLEDTIRKNTVNSNEVLVNLVNNLESEISLRETYLSTLRLQIDEMSILLSNDETELGEMQKHLTELRTISGYTALEGIGISVVLDDIPSSAVLPSNIGDLSQSIIHYQDLLYVVNDLRRGGAEAISINEQRVITSTEIRCVGNTILVNTTRLAPPYQIKAIGNPAALQNAIQSSDTYSRLQISGFPVNYTLTTSYSNELIQIPAYIGNYSTTYLNAKEQRSD